MKRFFTLLLGLVLLVSSAAGALAEDDVIIEDLSDMDYQRDDQGNH